MKSPFFKPSTIFWGTVFVFVFLYLSHDSAAGDKTFNPYVHDAPFEAEPYVPPPPPKSHLNLEDNGDGTIIDPDAGLMWARADSYADLNQCLNWYQSGDYAEALNLGGYDDWRMPTMGELVNLLDTTKENVKSFDQDPKFPLALDEKFADGAAYWYWSSDHTVTDLTDCCARSLYFVTGMGFTRRFTYCINGGVRPVRSIGKKPAANLK